MSQPNMDHSIGAVPPGASSSGQMGLAEIIQMCCLSGRSGQITYASGDHVGYVFLQHGQILHAQMEKVEGSEAVFIMLQWPGGTFTFDDDVLPVKRTISHTWEQLLFEGAQRADQGQDGEATFASYVPVAESQAVDRTRIQGGVPKLTIVGGTLPAQTFDLEGEFINVGRVEGNEIVLPDQAVSSKHCMFIRRGEDIFLRDLNAANGTFVNGEQVGETILKLGDIIQIGGVQLKFEAGVRRPKLRAQQPSPGLNSAASKQGVTPIMPTKIAAELRGKNSTVRLPKGLSAPDASEKEEPNRAGGTRAIVFEDLAKPEVKKPNWIPLIIALVVLLVGCAAAYFLFFKPQL